MSVLSGRPSGGTLITDNRAAKRTDVSYDGGYRLLIVASNVTAGL